MLMLKVASRVSGCENVDYVAVEKWHTRLRKMRVCVWYGMYHSEKNGRDCVL